MTAIEQITKQQLMAHLLLLDKDSRRCRFGIPATDDAIKLYVNNISDNDILLGIKSSLGDSLVIAAVHLAFMDDGSVDMGLSTLSECRRRGYAERLLRYTVDILRNRNVKQIYSICLPDNSALLKLLQKLNITAVYNHDGEREARIIIPMAGIDSIMNEFQNNNLVIIDKTMRPWAKLWTGMFQNN
jgi:ribosomal protein S18 acetylase RimI-like enzyme